GGMLLVVTGSLNSSSQRHLAYEIGRKDSERVRVVFNTSLGLYLIISAAIVLVGLALASPLVHGLLKIPPDREAAAMRGFQFTVLTMAVSFAATPFRGMFIAHQELVLSAVFD